MDKNHILYEYAFSESMQENDKINMLKNFIESENGYVLPDLDLIQPYIQQMLTIACYQSMNNLIDYILKNYEIIDVSYDNNSSFNQCKMTNTEGLLLLINHPSFTIEKYDLYKLFKYNKNAYEVAKIKYAKQLLLDKSNDKDLKILNEFKNMSINSEDVKTTIEFNSNILNNTKDDYVNIEKNEETPTLVNEETSNELPKEPILQPLNSNDNIDELKLKSD